MRPRRLLGEDYREDAVVPTPGDEAGHEDGPHLRGEIEAGEVVVGQRLGLGLQVREDVEGREEQLLERDIRAIRIPLVPADRADVQREAGQAVFVDRWRRVLGGPREGGLPAEWNSEMQAIRASEGTSNAASRSRSRCSITFGPAQTAGGTASIEPYGCAGHNEALASAVGRPMTIGVTATGKTVPWTRPRHISRLDRAASVRASQSHASSDADRSHGPYRARARGVRRLRSLLRAIGPVRDH